LFLTFSFPYADKYHLSL